MVAWCLGGMNTVITLHSSDECSDGGTNVFQTRCIIVVHLLSFISLTKIELEVAKVVDESSCVSKFSLFLYQKIFNRVILKIELEIATFWIV